MGTTASLSSAGVTWSPFPDSPLTEKSLMIAVRDRAPARRRHFGGQAHPRLRLPDGSRVAAVIPPCSVNGVTLTIRKFNARHFSINDYLVRIGTLPQSLASELENHVIQHRNILISGGTDHRKNDLAEYPGRLYSQR